MAKTYGYSSENLLTSASGGVTLGYDPALRLYQTVSGATTTRFLYDGVDAIAEYNATNALQRRFVFDPTNGQPVLWYEGTGTAATNRRYLGQDERGSVISVSGSTGASLGLNTYDEYGKPGAANLGRYQYTGQKWIGEAGLYDYHFRDYLPHLGIFAQTDPIGQVDSPNLYAYVLDDPVNLVDPLGLCTNGGGYVDYWWDPVSASWAPTIHCPVVETLGNRILDPNLRSNEAGGGGGGKEKNQEKPKSDYCSSLGYKVGDFIDNTIGNGTKVVGGGTVLAGGAVGLATAITGRWCRSRGCDSGLGRTNLRWGNSHINGWKWN